MTNYKKYIPISAPPDEVYRALTNPLSIKLWTGAEVEFEEVPGSEFSLWDGDIVGRNLSFKPNQEIVQQWYFGEENVPSTVTIKLHPDKNRTSMEWNQTNIPAKDIDAFVEGLEENYFDGLIDFFED